MLIQKKSQQTYFLRNAALCCVGSWPILRSATPLIGTDLRQIDTAAIAEPCRLDIDGDGKPLATSNGLILTRVLLGMTGTAVSSAAAAGAPRNTWDAIRAYLNGSCAMNLP